MHFVRAAHKGERGALAGKVVPRRALQVAVRLAADPTLGHFLLSSATWVFADHAIALKGALNRRIDMPVLARLLVDHTLHSTKSGTTFAFTRPTITMLPTA
jgi:hypothetical protein